MTGLSTIITSASAAFMEFERALYPSLTSNGVCFDRSVETVYRQAGYPHGKSRRGRKKWLKQNFELVYDKHCPVHGFEPVWIKK